MGGRGGRETAETTKCQIGRKNEKSLKTISTDSKKSEIPSPPELTRKKPNLLILFATSWFSTLQAWAFVFPPGAQCSKDPSNCGRSLLGCTLYWSYPLPDFLGSWWGHRYGISREEKTQTLPPVKYESSSEKMEKRKTICERFTCQTSWTTLHTSANYLYAKPIPTLPLL